MAYSKQNFTKGMPLTADQLNHIEDGIKVLEASINYNNTAGSGALTMRQIQALDAMFQNIAYDGTKSHELADTYSEFKFVFGLSQEKIVLGTLLSGFSFSSKNELHAEKNCICAMFNCTPNTNYVVTDHGEHNRFRFYGRLTKDDETTAVSGLPMDNIIADKTTNSNIDTLSTFSFNSEENQTIYIYLVGADSTLKPNLTIAEVH